MEAIHSLNDITIISLEIIINDKINNITESLLNVRDTKTIKTKNLSAIGSRNAPNFDGFFCLLANLPSRASDKEPITKKNTANDISTSELKQSKMATKIAKRNLLYVISVGKFFIDQSKFVGRSFKWPCLFIIFHSSIKILFHLSVNGFFNISS